MKKVLLVDDNVLFAEIERQIIETFNDAECIIFSNPINALHYLTKFNSVDIVVTDCHMPIMNGFEFAKEIISNNLNVKIIILSGYDEVTLKELREKYQLNGKVDICDKSNIDGLKQLIN